jgi:hypothetical protein
MRAQVTGNPDAEKKPYDQTKDAFAGEPGDVRKRAPQCVPRVQGIQQAHIPANRRVQLPPSVPPTKPTGFPTFPSQIARQAASGSGIAEPAGKKIRVDPRKFASDVALGSTRIVFEKLGNAVSVLVGWHGGVQ